MIVTLLIAVGTPKHVFFTLLYCNIDIFLKVFFAAWLNVKLYTLQYFQSFAT